MKFIQNYMQGLIAYYVKMTFFRYCCNQIGNFCVKSNVFANLKQLFMCVWWIKVQVPFCCLQPNTFLLLSVFPWLTGL